MSLKTGIRTVKKPYPLLLTAIRDIDIDKMRDGG